jgi:hypothetical protein
MSVQQLDLSHIENESDVSLDNMEEGKDQKKQPKV